MSNRFSKLVQDFLTSYIIGECNYSMNTKASYATTFHLLLEFLNKDVMNDYEQFLTSGKSYVTNSSKMRNLFNAFATTTNGMNIAVEKMNQSIQEVASAAQSTTTDVVTICESVSQINEKTEEISNEVQNIRVRMNNLLKIAQI